MPSTKLQSKPKKSAVAVEIGARAGSAGSAAAVERQPEMRAATHDSSTRRADRLAVADLAC